MTDTDSVDTIEEMNSTDDATNFSELTVSVIGPAGEPIEGAIVRGEVQSSEGNAAFEFGGKTDAEGTYVEEEAYANTYTIEVDHGEYEAATVEHDHDGESEMIVELDSPVAVAELTVRVVDPGGEAIAGASVEGEGQPHDMGIPLGFSGRTDAEGVYQDVIYENVYTITVDHEDYYPETVECTHDGDGELTVELAPIEGGLPDASRITVIVVDENGSPIEGVEVTGRGRPHEADIPLQFRGETNSNGRHPDVIYHNDYRIQADHPDYIGTVVQHTHNEPADVVVELESGPEKIPVEITAIHPDTGGAIKGAAVRLVRTSEPHSFTADAETGSDGAALLEVEAGKYHVLIAHDIDLTLVETEYTVTVDGVPVQASFEAITEPDDCVLTVEVINCETGRPIEGARIQADIWAENIDEIGLAAGESDRNGIAEIQGWRGTWELAVGCGGYRPADLGRIDVADNDSITVELEPRE